uniref:C2H2-type domain-containing protein n=1 Tax=viral metagenome TaxID=1070528 RepID=A0A6C0EEM0_9ZZZZ
MEKVITEFKCKKCNKKYASYQSLWIHNKKFHTNITDTKTIEIGTSKVAYGTKMVDNGTLLNTTTSSTKNISINNNLIENKKKCKFCERVFNDSSNKCKHEKICKKKINVLDSTIDKKFEVLTSKFFEIFNKEIKINPKKIQKINENKLQSTNNNSTNTIISDNTKILSYNNINTLISDKHKLISDNNTSNIKSKDNKIIKSDDNKFKFDLDKNFLTFHDKPIKYFYHNDQVYFKAKDIASILQYEDTKQAIRKNVSIDDRIKIKQLSGDGVWETPSPETSLLESEHPNTVFINESGFYCLILASKKTEAIKFKKWVTSIVLPSIRKTGSYNLIDNYIEEDLEKYHNKDCVYIIHIKDNIYKYGNTSHIFKRLQAHKTNLKYNKIIKIYEMNNMNDAIKLENKIKTLVKTLNINTVYNTHVEIFEVDNNNLQNLIKKIDELSLKIMHIKNYKNLELINENIKNLDIEKEKTKQEQEKTKQLELEKITKQLELEEKTKQLELEKITKQLELEEKTKQLEINNENIKLLIEFFKLTGKNLAL